MTRWEKVSDGHFRRVVQNRVVLAIHQRLEGYSGNLIADSQWIEFGFVGKTEKQAKSNITSKYKDLVSLLTGKRV